MKSLKQMQGKRAETRTENVQISVKVYRVKKEMKE